MEHSQESNLAWALIEVAKPELDTRERHHVFVTVGAGDSFTAIRITMKLIADKQIPLRPRLVQQCATWLEAYALHQDHERLSRLIDELSVPVVEPRARVIAQPRTCTRKSAVVSVSGPVESSARDCRWSSHNHACSDAASAYRSPDSGDGTTL